MSKQILNDRSVIITLGQVLSMALFEYIALLLGSADIRFRNCAVAHAAEPSESALGSPTTGSANATVPESETKSQSAGEGQRPPEQGQSIPQNQSLSIAARRGDSRRRGVRRRSKPIHI